MKVKIKVFRSDKYPDETMRYVDGHRKVLQAYGVTQVTSANIAWKDEPFTYIILVETIDGRVMGGGRVQLAGGSVPLPIETAIDDLDPRIFTLVKQKSLNGGTGEYCGLWNSKEIAGYGIGSIILVRVGMAVLPQLPLTSLFAFTSPSTLRLSLRVGYQILTEIGNNGTFYYPKEDLLATALSLEDPLILSKAAENDRNKILELRNNLKQTVIERGPKGEMEVEYDLNLMS